MDINLIFQYLNEYFIYPYDDNYKSVTDDMVFEEVEKKITGDFSDGYITANMYVRITNSLLNDGVYLVTYVDDAYITVAQDLFDETAEDIVVEYMRVPRDLRNAIPLITAETNVESGIASETQGSRSITWGSGGSSIWSKYGYVLNKYRSIGWS